MRRMIFASSLLLGMGGQALAADAVVEDVVVEAPAGFNWTGLYVGVHGAYSWGEADTSYDDPVLAGLAGGPLEMEPEGGFGGVQIGYNYQMPSNIVLGVEAAISYADISDTIPDVLAVQLGNDEVLDSDTDFVGMFRGRLGYAVDRFLPFVTGGLAVAHSEIHSSDLDRSDDKTLTGWTAGAGIEVAIDDTWSVSAEYMYTDLGDETWFEGEEFEATGDSTANAVRISLNAGF